MPKMKETPPSGLSPDPVSNSDAEQKSPNPMLGQVLQKLELGLLSNTSSKSSEEHKSTELIKKEC